MGEHVRIEEEFEDDAWIDKHLDRIQRAASQHDDRLERLGDAQFRLTDQALNGTVMTAIERIEVIRRIPFRSPQ